MNVQRIRRMFDINVLGTFLCTREALRRMSTRHGGKGGCIVNVSSVAARLGGPGQYVDYSASKGAIDTFTIGLAKEVAPRAFASTPCVPASSRPTSMPRAANPTGRAKWRQWCRCSAPAARTKSPTPSSG